MDKLVLFDIDKTLIGFHKGHSLAFSKAFQDIYDVDTNIDIINHQGMTDQQIIIKVLGKNGLSESEIKSKIDSCMESMGKYFGMMANGIEMRVMEGVPELLEELKKRTLLGLVTGNIEPIARKKLERASLYNYFDVGGFGSDDMSRSKLVKIALEMAEKNHDFRFNDNVFLIGDTPLDINAGNEAGVKTIGVATGEYSQEDLSRASASYVVSDLSDTNKILDIVHGRYVEPK